MQDQCITLDQAKRLAELGVIEKSICVWYVPSMKEYQPYVQFARPADNSNSNFFRAYTVAELGVMLPTLGIKRYKSNNGRGSDYYWLEYQSQDWSDLNEASLLAKVLIYLLEENMTTAEQVNSRLNPQIPVS